MISLFFSNITLAHDNTGHNIIHLLIEEKIENHQMSP